MAQPDERPDHWTTAGAFRDIINLRPGLEVVEGDGYVSVTIAGVDWKAPAA